MGLRRRRQGSLRPLAVLVHEDGWLRGGIRESVLAYVLGCRGSLPGQRLQPGVQGITPAWRSSSSGPTRKSSRRPQKGSSCRKCPSIARRTTARRIDALASLMGSLPACLLACLLLAALGLQFARGCLCLASTEPCPTALKGQLPSEAFKQTAAVVAASLAPTP